MDKSSKVAYGLALASLALVFLAGKAAIDRVELGRDLRSTEAAILALATLSQTCHVGAQIDWIEDEFADAMQNNPNWCRGTVLEVLNGWDTTLSYKFKGSTRVEDFHFRWERDNELQPGQRDVRKRLLASDPQRLREDAPFHYELIHYIAQPPLIGNHELWFASGHVEDLNFGERIAIDEWVTYLEIPVRPRDLAKARYFNLNDLRERIAATSVRWSVPTREPEKVYSFLLSKWESQAIRVPLVELDLPFSGATVALALVGLLQLVWLSAILPSVTLEDCPELVERLSLSVRLRSSSSRSEKAIAILDWTSLAVCQALILSAPTVIAVSATMVTVLLHGPLWPSVVATSLALVSAVPALRIVVTLERLKGELRS